MGAFTQQPHSPTQRDDRFRDETNLEAYATQRKRTGDYGSKPGFNLGLDERGLLIAQVKRLPAGEPQYREEIAR